MKLSSILGTACALAFFIAVDADAASLASDAFSGSSLASSDTDLTSAASAIALGSGLDETNHPADDVFTFSITPNTVSGDRTTAFDSGRFDLGKADAALTPGTSTSQGSVNFDNVDRTAGSTEITNIGVVPTAPEPGVNALLALGTLGLTGFAVRRRIAA